MNDKKKKDTSNQIIKKAILTKIKVIFSISFILLIVHLINIVVYKSEEIIANPSNPLLNINKKTVIRGTIYDRQLNPLAFSRQNPDTKEYDRIYPYDDLFFHVIGYTQPIMEGVELTANQYLMKANRGIFEYLFDKLNSNIPNGFDIVTTLDLEIQKLSYELLGSYQGAILVLEPTTGKILAMVSNPSVNANNINTDYESIRIDENKPLLNRVTQGLYPPGSTFKIIPALGMIQNGTYESFSYECVGSDYFNHNKITCYNGTAHGLVNLSEAFAYSCNTFFAKAGVELGYEKIKQVGEQLLFNQHLDLKMNTKKSKLPLEQGVSIEKIAETAMGQGDTQVTPLHMAMITSAISNGGIIYKPYVVDYARDDQQRIVKKYTPQIYKTIMEPDEADQLKTYMRRVVTEGTAKNIVINKPEVKMYGKTGTAEAGEGENEVDHSWFIGFSEVKRPDLVVVVLVEEGGTSSKKAVPIAKKIVEAYYQ